MPPRLKLQRKVAATSATKKQRDKYVAEKIRKSLAVQIRALRGELSQLEFARKIGMQRPSVSRLENDSGVMSLRTLLRIAAKMDVALVTRFVPHDEFLDAMDKTPRKARRKKTPALA
ncbi:MAG TPA: helix-turn-helix transcriptional regulator [Rhizomicrobium sp.]|jgi:transcriptional regulator with XRE-family HTH domain